MTERERISGPAIYVLAVLALVNVVNFLDRQILYILVEPIKHDLSLTDSEIGLLTGLSFAIVYGVFGVLLARLADRWSRSGLIACSLLIWSAMTAIGGFSQSFLQLALSRLGVALGEAGSTPSSHRLIAEYFPESRRATAFALFAAATPVGVMIGFAGGGWIAQVADWRTALFVMGVPGLLLCLLVASTIRDPVMPFEEKTVDGNDDGIAALLRIPTVRRLLAGTAFYAVASYGLSAFQSSFFIRVHGFSLLHTGLVLGGIHGVAGGLGTLCGGIVADRLAVRDARWRQWVPAMGGAISVPFCLAAWLVSDGNMSALLMDVPIFTGIFYFAPTIGVLQSLAPPGARATASALLFVAISLVGQTTGPLLIGIISDWWTPSFHTDALRYALCLVAVPQILSALIFYRSGVGLPRDLEIARLKKIRDAGL